MGSGKWGRDTIGAAMDLAVRSSGDLAEFGCARGDCTKLLAAEARRLGRRVHAFDSFIGMGNPGPHDAGYYKSGQFDVGGAAHFAVLLGGAKDIVDVHPGWLPGSLVLNDMQFSLAVVDLDHHDPTAGVLEWLTGRAEVIACDDYLPETQADLLATKAIHDWRERVVCERIVANGNDQVTFVRPTWC